MPQDFYDSSDGEEVQPVRKAPRLEHSRPVTAPLRPSTTADDVSCDSSTEDDESVVLVGSSLAGMAKRGPRRPNSAQNAPSKAQRLPQEVLNMVFAFLIEDEDKQWPSIWRRQVRKEDLRQFLRMGTTCSRFYRCLEPLFLENVCLSTAIQCKRRLDSIDAYMSFYRATHYPATCLRLNFERFNSRVIVHEQAQLDPSLVQQVIARLGPSLQCVVLEIDPGTATEHSRFFEGAETDDERVVRLLGRRLGGERGDIEMQTALNTFEDFEIEELQVLGRMNHPCLFWPSDGATEGERLRSLRSFVLNSFSTTQFLRKLHLRDIYDGWEVALFPFEALKTLRLQGGCGFRPHDGRVMPVLTEAGLNQLSALEIIEPIGMSAALIYMLARRHAGSLRRFALVTSPAWGVRLDEDAVGRAHALLAQTQAMMAAGTASIGVSTTQPGSGVMPASLGAGISGGVSKPTVGGLPIGEALVVLLKPTIQHLMLGGHRCVSEDVYAQFRAGRGAPNLQTLAFVACDTYSESADESAYTNRFSRRAAVPTHSEIDALQHGINANGLADFVEDHKGLCLPSLRRLEIWNMRMGWLWHDWTDDHIHHIYNPRSKEQRAQRGREERRQQPRLEEVCQDQGVVFSQYDSGGEY